MNSWLDKMKCSGIWSRQGWWHG